jgi:alpha-L-rhamnosidase
MSQITVTGLRCEYAENPIGVHASNPVFSWRTEASGAVQSAYQIVMASTKAELDAGEYTIWNSGRVNDSKFYDIRYGGSALSSSRRVWWKVRVWDENGAASGFSEPAFFEMGLLKASDWKGRWMSFLGGMIGNGMLFRYSFTLDKKPVWARAYIAGLGYYELRLNGSRVGDKLLDPGATDYSKTVLYSAYDVGAALRQGLNTVGIILGTGWIGHPKTLFQLNVQYEDGTVKEFFTDWGIGWVVARGPITYNSIYDGENYDAGMEKDGWDTPEYEDQATEDHQRPWGWIHATIVEPPGGELVGELLPPIRVTGTSEPKLLKTFPDGRELWDAGVNQTGWVRMKVAGESGASVSLHFAEVLNEEGDLQLLPLRTARCEDTYILRGGRDVEEYAPRFTYHGFRYFTVKKTGKVEVKSFTVEFARTDLPRNAKFKSDNAFLNRMADIMWHTDACNIFSIPTDCCNRDERHGWGTDPTVRIEGCVYHFDVGSFFEKWLRDIFDTQSEDGYFADTAPHRWGRRPCDPQVNVPALLPLLLYHSYGNRRALEKTYEPLKKYVQALLIEADHLIVSRTGWGEWACPKSECYDEPHGPGATSRNVDPALVSTAYMYYSVALVAESAGILGKSNEAAYYADVASFIRGRYNDRWLNRETCQYDRGTQSANTISLALGLTEKEYRAKVAANIAADVKAQGYHLTTGSMGTKLILEVLSQYGYDDVVYEVMNNKTSPGFGYMLENGATSIWERWEADRDNNIMNSYNQPMLAAAGIWFYKYLGGIGMEETSEAFRDLVITPHAPSQMKFVEAEMDIPAGKVKTAWERKDDSFVLKVTIPFNTTARVCIPVFVQSGAKALALNGKSAGSVVNGNWEITVKAGTHEFVLR